MAQTLDGCFRPLLRLLWGSLRRSCFAISCSVQGKQLSRHQSLWASVAAGDASTPVDEDGEEPAEERNPTFPQLQALIFQQLKNAILVEVLEAVAG